ncbi:NADPH dehydrogenase/ 2,4-dienoyl-CoA reductase (NADPH) [Halovivax asiaticus JCM 14624]|uniref:NADPH dehydrogenase/ 2,4-dienoyl-CoA reductase (NADPH) n=1 Tax=Halovivax asiaticus JCM 14624 TaxID=1227490 RepID=M0BJL6_9EURY|nr:NADH:flavin oxidoreductase/NADH oxidase [Halovivax asiaticus]ELZ11030.1 NADPH dehydrogenase/ 2,4-dienoyl-CoA reductase (NADPH) [Halovivax asiaticus JCM 14624]
MTDDVFSPLAIRETTIRNRFTLSPMCQYSVEERDGLATDWHRVHLGSRAVGGAGVVLTEATAVEERGRITPEDLGIWSDAHRDALAPVAEFVKSQGATPGIQLAHAGRKASKTRPWDGSEPLQLDDGGWETVAPSAVPYPYDEDPPVTTRLDAAGIADVVDSFRAGARRAREAGFEIAEIHAAHGYLLHEFLSPITNHRDDEYGGSFRNRTRIVREITEAVRDEMGDGRPVFVRISATDWVDDRDSWDIEQSVRLADDLSELGADLIDVSSGGIHPDQTVDWVGPNYQLRFAERIRNECDTDVKVGTVGGITAAEQADAIIRNDRADLAVVGRKFLEDPHFPLHAAVELGREDAVDVPVQYQRGF